MSQFLSTTSQLYFVIKTILIMIKGSCINPYYDFEHIWRKIQKLVAIFLNDILVSYLFDGIPIENIVIRESLSMKQVSNELSEVCIIWLFFKSQGTTIIQIRGKFSYNKEIVL